MLNVKNKETTNGEKIFNFLAQDDICISLLNSLIDKLNIIQEKKNKCFSKFYGCKENALELYEYYQENNIVPINVIDNKDGTITHIYEDGTKIVLNITFTGLPRGLTLVKRR